MTLQELYGNINGDYDRVIRVLRMDKLIDKHIRKFIQNGVPEALIEAGATMEPTQMFETAHAVKGVTANLGLNALSETASILADEFRPGSSRTMSDEQVKEQLRAFEEQYRKTVEGIQAYEGE